MNTTYEMEYSATDRNGRKIVFMIEVKTKGFTKKERRRLANAFADAVIKEYNDIDSSEVFEKIDEIVKKKK